MLLFIYDVVVLNLLSAATLDHSRGALWGTDSSWEKDNDNLPRNTEEKNNSMLW